MTFTTLKALHWWSTLDMPGECIAIRAAATTMLFASPGKDLTYYASGCVTPVLAALLAAEANYWLKHDLEALINAFLLYTQAT